MFSSGLPLTPGSLIGGHYIIGTLPNTGGFGAVYRGVDTSEGNRPCAIKETYDVTPAARRQALTEAAVLFTEFMGCCLYLIVTLTLTLIVALRAPLCSRIDNVNES